LYRPDADRDLENWPLLDADLDPDCCSLLDADRGADRGWTRFDADCDF
jgi:hypothetical protein